MSRPKHQDSSQVFDVSKPGRSAPSHTSRPVIMDPRQIADDPMVSGGADSSELMTHSKPIVPIQVSSDSHQDSLEVTKTDTPHNAHNNFGNKDDAPAGEQSYEPPEQAESTAAGPESPSGFQAGSVSQAQPTSPPPDTQVPAEDVPLPAALTAPEIDDPAGLSSVDSSAALFPSFTPAAEHGQPNQINQSEEHSVPGEHKSEASGVPHIAEQLPPVPENIGEIEALPFPAHHGNFTSAPNPRKWFIPSFILLLIGVFLVFDAGIIGSGKLPFELLKNEEDVAAEPVPIPQPRIASTQVAETAKPNTQAGLSQYSLVGTPLSFSYPTEWGNPIVTADPGFLKRGGTNKTSGIYSRLIAFEANKDIQLALTSNKFLPAARTAQYYDYLQWCSGTHDSKIYRQKLLFTSASGVDTPTTISCNDGPLTDASKLDELTIIQKNTKDGAGKPAGDIYTKNLLDTEFVVIRVKDTAATNGESIKTLLASVKLVNQPTSSN